MTVGQLAIVVAIACGSSAALAQFVKGNEVNQATPDGTKRVETPPLPTTGPIRSTKPCAATGNCHGGAWLDARNPGRAARVHGAYARPGTCRASSYGTTRLLRLWAAKSGGARLQCQLPDVASRCVNMFARLPVNSPYPAVQ